MTTKDIAKAGKLGLSILDDLLAERKKASDVISVQKNDGEWCVVVEALERKAIPDTQDILGKYELRLDENMELLNYKRIGMRRRSQLEVEE